MKLVVKSKMTSAYRLPGGVNDGLSYDWKTQEFEFEKIGLFKKPEFQVKNLYIQIIKKENNYIICKTSDKLGVDLDEQKRIEESELNDLDLREMIKEKLDFLKSKGKYIDVKLKGCAFYEFPVTLNPLALVTLSDDVNYHYLFSIVD